ncbi:MAG: M24 family metallopeptidase, partial [Bradyrhizobium sp.]
LIRPQTSALEQLLSSRNLEAIACLSPENFTYLAGVHITTVENIRPRLAFAVLRRTGVPFLVICSIETSLARSASWIENIWPYTEFVDDPVIAFANALEENGLGGARIGTDLNYLPASSYQRLRERLPRLQMEDITEDVARIRSIKSVEEIAFLERTTRDTHRAVLEGIAESKVGDSEGVIARRIVHRMIDDGANGLLHVHLASGERSSHIHNHPGDARTAEGEILRLDVGGIYGPYCSDLARTYSTGNPSQLQRVTYRKLREVHEAIITAMKPGVPAAYFYDLCKTELEKRNLPCTLPHIGHSFGIETHETPMIRPGDMTPLAPGMVINIEPMTLDSEGSCYHIEDAVLITEDGNRLLTLGLSPIEIPVLGDPVILP